MDDEYDDGVASELYAHVVRDHGWEARPSLFEQRLADLHRLEHTEAILGMVAVEHRHGPGVTEDWFKRPA